MRHASLFVGTGILGLAIAWGCGGSGSGIDTSGTGTSGGNPEAGASSSGGGQLLAGDIPCDVAQIIAKSCTTSCHTEPPLGGAKVPLTKRAHFLAPSPTDSSKNVGQMSVQRMKDTKRPMPPDGMLPDSDVAILQAWVDKGMPDGQCATPPEIGKSPYDTPKDVCTSDTFWTRGEIESNDMFPGQACNKCHTARRRPTITSFGGTVYPTAHEKDDCYGGSSVVGSKVVVTDVNGAQLFEMKVTNSSGNFSRRGTFAMPAEGVRVKVVGPDGVKQRVMSEPIKNGDCNLCHTMEGTNDGTPGTPNAPGRVLLP